MWKNTFIKSQGVGQLSNTEIAMFCEEMSIIMKAGISVMEGCYILREDAETAQDKEVFSRIIDKLEDGNSFTTAIKSEDIFPNYMVNMIEIGEVSGRLEQVFHALFVYYKKEAELARMIKSSVVYPLLILAMMLIVVSSIVFYVLPIFSTVYQQLGSSSTGITGLILNVGIRMKTHSRVIIMVVIFCFILVLFFRYTMVGNQIHKNIFRKLLGNHKLVQKIAIARFTNGMALLLSSGVDIDRSLELVEVLVDHQKLKERISNTKNEILEGTSFAVAVENNHLLSGIYAKMLSIGAKTGTIDEVIQSISNRYEEEVERDLVKVISIVEPLLVGILAVVVGGVLLTVMLPLVNIISQIG